MFKRDVIEALGHTERFRIVTPVGTFEMTKAQFYAAFPRVPLTESYRKHGVYSYPKLPAAVEPFRK